MTKQSPVAHKFDEDLYEFGEVNGYRVPLTKRDKTNTEIKNCGVMLCDVSSSRRAGYRGMSVEQWLMKQHQVQLPEINQAFAVDQNCLIVRLSETEIMILEGVADKECDFPGIIDNSNTDLTSEQHPEIYYLPRQDSHACFIVMGECCVELFSKLCAVDLNIDKFTNMDVVRTSMARASVIIIRQDRAGYPSYLILIDTSLAEYLWDCLLDAMQEFNGVVSEYNMIEKL